MASRQQPRRRFEWLEKLLAEFLQRGATSLQTKTKMSDKNINENLHLNSKLFQPELESKSMRAGFGEGLVAAAQANKNIVGLCADLTESTGMQAFKNAFPERFIEIGVAEQNLVTVAAGMAAMKKIPFAASYAIFSPGRNWEQIRTTICYNNLPVKIIGSHVGLNVGPDGGSHQALEDIALMRALPRMVVISPCDAIQAKKATIAASKTSDPTYIRLVREKSPVITTDETPFEIGKAQIVYESGRSISNMSTNKAGAQFSSAGSDRVKPAITKSTITNPANQNAVGIIATGPMLYRALVAAKKLTSEGKSVTVMNIHTIKPLDEQAVIRLAHETRALVTVEEHQIIGGLGSAVAECLAAHFPVPIEFVGVKDVFGQSGNTNELLELYGLDSKDIYNAAKRVMLRGH
jgi:transketolase